MLPADKRRDAFIGRKTTLGIHDNEGVAKCRRNEKQETENAKGNPIADGEHTR